MSTETKESKIYPEVRLLKSELEALEQAYVKLSERLEPVLSACPPATDSNKSDVAQSGVLLLDALISLRTHAASITARVRTDTTRLVL